MQVHNAKLTANLELLAWTSWIRDKAQQNHVTLSKAKGDMWNWWNLGHLKTIVDEWLWGLKWIQKLKKVTSIRVRGWKSSMLGMHKMIISFNKLSDRCGFLKQNDKPKALQKRRLLQSEWLRQLTLQLPRNRLPWSKGCSHTWFQMGIHYNWYHFCTVSHLYSYP